MTTSTLSAPIAERVSALPWAELHADLDDRGFAQTPVVLSPRECSELSGRYPSGSFRSTIAMARHRFGEGEYKYFDRPLPEPIQELRTSFYGPLAEAANRWAQRLGEDVRYPAELEPSWSVVAARGRCGRRR